MSKKQETQHISLIPYSCGWGAKKRGCALGPQVLKRWGLQEKLNKSFSWTPFYQDEELFDNPTFSSSKEKQLSYLPRLLEHEIHLFEAVQQSLKDGNFPIVIGGDHSQAIGTFSALIEHFQCHHTFGLIWIDAHLDAHTPETSPSGAFHGMPIASLMGMGAKELSTLGSGKAKLLPQNLCYIGVRSFEKEEESLIKNSGAHLYLMEEVNRRGFAEIFKESLEIVCRGNTCFGVSIDIDSFDPKFAPGTGSLENDGLDPKEVLQSLKGLYKHPQLKVVEITEYNPELDVDMKTAHLCFDIIQTLFSEQ